MELLQNFTYHFAAASFHLSQEEELLMSNEYILEMKNITKTFPGVKALDDVTLRVRPATVHSLMGENGAGKSTLMKCLFGIYSLNGGEIILDGKQVNFSSPSDALVNHVS